MRHLCQIVLVCGLFGAWSGAAAAAAVIDFEDLPDSPFLSYTEGRVTFTAVDGGLLKRDLAPNGTLALRAVTSPYPEMRADIAGGASSVSVDLGDYANIDSETVFLEIFDAADNSLGFISEDVPIDRMGMTPLELSGPCFAYAIFGARNSSINNGSSVRADNFTFGDNPCVCIPTPDTLLLGGIGTLLVGYLRRRRTL